MDRPLSRAETMLRTVARAEFGDAVMDYVAETGMLRSFGSYFVAEIARPRAVLSFSHGEVSEYWFRRRADTLLASESVQRDLIERVLAMPEGRVAMTVLRPGEDDVRREVYDRSGVLETLVVSSRGRRTAHHTFFLRHWRDGPVSAPELARFGETLPLAHEAMRLRHRIVGSEAFRHAGLIGVTRLKEQNLAGFEALSVREAEVCDAVVEGLSIAGTAVRLGIAEVTVKTLRRRAYRKLGIASAGELHGLMLRERAALVS